uniref:Astacin domain-containing protein n=1 Tax=Meloidogyne hapla TaxID=6305 RepID=A0A1I8B704_MELHA
MSSSIFKYFITILLIFLIINNCNTSRSLIKIHRHFNGYTKPIPLKEINKEELDESPVLRLIRSFQQREKKQKEKKQNKFENQCWIRINKKLGEFYYESGKCECLYDKKYICIGETHVDLNNHYC